MTDNSHQHPYKKARTGAHYAATTGTAIAAPKGRAETACLLSTDSSEVFCPADHAEMLGLPVQQPEIPTTPTEFSIRAGEDTSKVSSYITKLWASVEWRLSAFLFGDSGVKLRKPLCQLRTPAFDCPHSGAPTGYKEPWNMEHCAQSLSQSGFYESSLTAWHFDVALNLFDKVDLGRDAITWNQYESSGCLWSDSRLVASSSSPANQRLIYEGFVPSAVSSIDIVKQLHNTDGFFKGLPVCGGHAQLWSLIGALHHALDRHAGGDAEAQATILQLYGASINVTCRLRLSPDETMIRLDELGHMDLMRVQQVGFAVVSFHQFAMRVLALPEINGIETGPDLVKKLGVFGVTFKGKVIDKGIAYSILAIVGIADKGSSIGMEAFHFLDGIDARVLSDPTKIAKIIRAVKNICIRDDCVDAVVSIVEAIAIAILSGDKNAEDFSNSYMVPSTRRGIGFVHVVVHRLKFNTCFFEALLTSASDGTCPLLSVAGILLLKGVCKSIKTFWTKFAAKEKIVGEPSHLSYVADKFAVFRETLTCEGDKHAADFMLGVMTDQFYEGFVEVAARGATFAEVFNSAGSADHNGKFGNNVLHLALQNFRRSLITPLIPPTIPPPAADDHHTVPPETSDYSKTLLNKVTTIRKKTINFIEFDYASPSAWKKETNGTAAKATQMLRRSTLAKSDSRHSRKEHSLFMLNSELFPNKDSWDKPDAMKQPVALTESLEEAARWACASKLPNSICLFADGRTRKIRRSFEDIVDESQTDENKVFDGQITYAVPNTKDDPRFAKRKVFASLSNRESLIGILPQAKVRMHMKKRDHYSACGEHTTHAATYSNAKVRPWDKLPRLHLADKEKMTGKDMPVYAADVFVSLKAGHPLFMLEVKEVEVYLALFSDMNVTHVFDLAAGSGAAAMAAAILRIHYEGFVMNAQHGLWLNRIMDKVMCALVVDSIDTESMTIRSEVSQYFNSYIEEARLLMAGATVRGVVGDNDCSQSEANDDDD